MKVRTFEKTKEKRKHLVTLTRAFLKKIPLRVINRQTKLEIPEQCCYRSKSKWLSIECVTTSAPSMSPNKYATISFI